MEIADLLPEAVGEVPSKNPSPHGGNFVVGDIMGDLVIPEDSVLLNDGFMLDNDLLLGDMFGVDLIFC